MTDLFDKVVDFENLHVAYHAARASKRYRASILKFGYCIEDNLVALHRALQDKTYRHGVYREFIINDSKKRLIKAAPFRDRVVHHAVCNIIEPILERSFIYDSYACRKGRGTHAAVLRLEHFVRSLRGTGLRGGKSASPIYCLKCDISKYFDSVDHGVLLAILRRNIHDEDILWLLQEIIESSPNRGIHRTWDKLLTELMRRFEDPATQKLTLSNRISRSS